MTATATTATVYGYPRQGQNRELKKAIEGYWKGDVTADALRATAADLRQTNWRQLADNGIDEAPTGDFSYYDRVLGQSRLRSEDPRLARGPRLTGEPRHCGPYGPRRDTVT